MSEILPGFAEPSKPKWEYRVYTVLNSGLDRERYLTKPELRPEGGAAEAEINKLADDGWELIAPVTQLGEDELVLIFRRSK